MVRLEKINGKNVWDMATIFYNDEDRDYDAFVDELEKILTEY